MDAKLSYLGLFQNNRSLFDGMELPDGMNRRFVINRLLLETSELEALYHDAKTAQFAITNWAYCRKPIWDKLYSTEKLEYNPIWNVDGTETITGTDSRISENAQKRSRELEGSEDTSDSSRDSENTTDSRNIDENSNNIVDTVGQNTSSENVNDFTAAYDAAELQQKDKTDKAVTDSNSSKVSTVSEDKTKNTGESAKNSTHSGDVNRKNREKESWNDGGTTKDSGENKTVTVRQGNIGVTSTQSLIQEERELDKFSTIDYIIGDFKLNFCLLVY